LKQKDHYILWPVYFDSRKTRKEGRRVPKKLSVENPRVEEIIKALEAMGIEGKIEKDKAYPRCWWEGGGRVLVRKDACSFNKRRLILEVAKLLHRMRKK